MISRPLRDSEKRVLRRLRQGPLPMDHWKTMTPNASFSKALQVHVCFLRQAGCVVEMRNHAYYLIEEPAGLLNEEIELVVDGEGITLVRSDDEVFINGIETHCNVFQTSVDREQIKRMIGFLQDALL